MTNTINAETAVIACLLTDAKRTLYKVEPILLTTDFLNPVNKSIYESILKLNAEKKEIDCMSVYEILRAAGSNIMVSYLSELADCYTYLSNIITYTEQVKERSNKKQVLEKLISAQTELLESGDVNKALNEITNLKLSDNSQESIGLNNLISIIYPQVKIGKTQGLLTGFEKFDRNTKGFHNQNLILLASGAGRGKTAMALNIIKNIISGGFNVLMYSLEMSAEEIGKRLLTIYSGISSDLSDQELEKNNSFDDQVKKRLKYMGELSKLGFEIVDKSQKLSKLVTGIKVKCIEAKHKGKPLDLIVIDYIQLIIADNEKINREQQVSDIAYKLKNLAKDINIPILALVQCNRFADKEKGREYEIYDLRESGALEQSADLVFFINRWVEKIDKNDVVKYNYSIKKYRHGKNFYCSLNFNSDILTFAEVDDEKKF